jgi:spore coat protein A
VRLIRTTPLLVLLLAPSAALAQQQTVTLRATRDAGIMAEDGTLANGSGTGFHVGVNNNGDERRALIRFNMGAIPSGSTIDSVRLRLYMSRSNGGNIDVELHRITRSWSEGPANPNAGEGKGAPASAGDVTWTHAVYDTSLWTTPGGDYAAAASATRTVGTAIQTYAWSSATLVSDVQAWVDGTRSNEGWILIAPGAGTADARRFESRETSQSSQRPALIVTFTAANPTGACCAGDGTCSVVDAPGTACTGSYQGDGSDCSPNPCPQPQGACCLPDSSGTCDLVTEAECAAAGGSYGGDGSGCGAAMCPVVLAPFVDPLPIPPTAQPVAGAAGGAAEYEIAAVEFEQRLHRDLPPTRVWGWDDGSSGPIYPGPTIVARRDEPVAVTWRNDIRGPDGVPRTSHLLPVDSCIHGAADAANMVVHLHGGHVPAESDGYPEDAYGPGQELTYQYPNGQQAATLWYHDHALGITRLNVYLGLAGLYVVHDAEEEALALPDGAHDIPLVIQDRSFNPDGSLIYPASWMEHFAGNSILVNGRVWPYLEVDRGKYRFRVLNGSNSRFYRLALSDDSAFDVIATDTGLLAAPARVTSVLVGPGERIELVVNFAGYDPGARVRLVNSAPAPFPGTAGEGVVANVMQFRIGSEAGFTDPLPDALREVSTLDPAEAAAERDFELSRVDDPECGGARWLINGKEWDDITEQPRLGTVEVWRFINRSGFTHPMHMHLVSFRILDRQEFGVLDGEIQPIGDPVPPAAWEDGWKDTVEVGPNEMVRVIARFEDFVGRFPYHCHMLEHEDHEMMRQFETTTTCGDGVVGRPLEDCDEGGGGETAGCDQDCTTPACGDGVVNEAAGEQCDDGKQEDGDGCSAECLDEPGGGDGDDGCGCRAGDASGAAGWLLLLALAATRRRRRASTGARSGGPAGS